MDDGTTMTPRRLGIGAGQHAKRLVIMAAMIRLARTKRADQ